MRVISASVTPELLKASADNTLLSIELREYAGAPDIGDAQLVIAATDSPSVNEAVARDASGLARLVNVSDSPELGSFVSMAIHRAGPVTIGVSTGSVPPAAVRIRDALAKRFDVRYAEAVSACVKLRAEILAEHGSAGWASMHPTLIGPDFCDRVESATFCEEPASCRS